MLRQSIIIDMVNNRSFPARNVGIDWVRPEARAPIEGNQLPFGIGFPNSAPYPFAPDGHDNPGGAHDPRGPRWAQEHAVRYVWEPHLISVSGRVSDGPNVSTTPTDEFLISFVSYRIWTDHREPSPSDDALATTNEQQPIAGVRSGIIGGREVYASGGGGGYRFPRQVLPDTSCAQKVYRYFALTLTWDLDVEHKGAFVIDWEWKLAEV